MRHLPLSVRLTMENPNSYRLSETVTRYCVYSALPEASCTTRMPYLLETLHRLSSDWWVAEV